MPLLLGIPIAYWLAGGALATVGVGGAAAGAYAHDALTADPLSSDPAVLQQQEEVLLAGRAWYANPWIVGFITVPIGAITLYKLAK